MSSSNCKMVYPFHFEKSLYAHIYLDECLSPTTAAGSIFLCIPSHNNTNIIPIYKYLQLLNHPCYSSCMFGQNAVQSGAWSCAGCWLAFWFDLILFLFQASLYMGIVCTTLPGQLCLMRHPHDQINWISNLSLRFGIGVLCTCWGIKL